MNGTIILTISFPKTDRDLHTWLLEQVNPQKEGFGSKNAIVRKCLRIVKEKNLLEE